MIRTIALLLIASVTCSCQAEDVSIEGDWEVIAYSGAGKYEPERGGVGKTYQITKKQFITVGEEESESYRYRVDPKKEHLDWYRVGNELDLPLECLYTVQGDTLTITHAFLGKPRPKFFRPYLKQNVGVFVLRRKK